MRTSFLQDLYLQRPVTAMLLISVIAVLPWIGMGDFATKGEPREAAVAVSMLETGDWILPHSYADEFAYKPPMSHWLMAAFSYPQGYVSEFTARLPSALAFIWLVGSMLVFFGKRIGKFREVFIAACLLITSFEIHRAAMTARVDMLFTTFIVLALFQLYRWEERQELKGLPLSVPLLLSLATLTKGPAGIILPLFVFAVYLLLLGKYRFPAILRTTVYAGLSALFLPLLWYIAAWKQGGHDFLNLVIAENFGRFFHFDVTAVSYELGHENGAWYNLATLLAGFIPWTVLLFFSLCGMKIRKPRNRFASILQQSWTRLRNMEKVRLFSLVAAFCILFFYSIPSSKRSVYLMPAYPFIAIFIAQYILYVTEYRKAIRTFAVFIAAAATLAAAILLPVMVRAIDPVAIVRPYTEDPALLHTLGALSQSLASPGPLTCLITGLWLLTLGITVYHIFRKINIKILYATAALIFCTYLLTDGVIMREERCANSCRPFARQIMRDYPLQEGNVYVMNNPREYANLYGLNFYMGNIFRNFGEETPRTGYFLATQTAMEKVIRLYGDTYTFRILTSTPDEIKEVRQKIVLSRFTAKTLPPL
jgi:4-amino-4-deoxy-L-arabinose transferase-like glycosyltransferase